MKKIIVLLSALALLSSCGGIKTYDWNGVCLLVDTEDFQMVDVSDQANSASFTLIDKAHPRNRAVYRLVSNPSYKDMSQKALVGMYGDKVRSMWSKVCANPQFSASSGTPLSLNPQFPDGIGEYVSYEGTRGGKPVWGVIAVNGYSVFEVSVEAECDNQASRDAFLGKFRAFTFPRTYEDTGEWDESVLLGH